ncbi:hypothetical protein [Rhizobium rhizoryzae]|uniref:hypothetical protein n=1 Tax=Rhizobium rhizoryzae TaxID=451876 RepID=UPI00289B2A31|nr:hypothetical protein [Rhizobium rhizoryzae]
MQLPKELLHPLAGLRLLAKGDARGLSNFDISDDGIIRSFRAFLFCLPVYLAFAIFARIEFLNVFPDLGRPHAVFIFQALVVAASNWCFTILCLILAGFLLDIRPLIRPLIVILNWSAVPVLYAGALITPILPLFRYSPTLKWVVAVLLVILLCTLFIVTWRVLHTVVGGSKWKRAAFMLLVFLPPILISRFLENSMRLTVS